MWLRRLVLSLPVLGTLPFFRLLNKSIASQNERMEALMTAEEKVANIRAEEGSAKATKSNLPPAVKNEYNGGDKFCFQRKTKMYTGIERC